MMFLPVVERELRAATRRAVSRWSRLAAAGLAAVLVGFTLVFTQAISVQAGAGVFRLVVWLLFLYASMAGVFLTADCLSSERREGTLGLLFLTDLRSYDVVLGKLVGRAVTGFYGWMAVLPVLAISMLMGGVTGGEFWRIALALVSVLGLSLTTGLAVSSVMRSEPRVLGATFVVLLLLNAGAPLMNQVLSTFGWPALLPAGLSPAQCCRAAFDLSYRARPGLFWSGLLLMQGMSWASLLFACWILPRRWRDDGGPKAAQRRRRTGWWVRGAPGPATPGRPVEGNPITWLAGRTVLMSEVSLWWVLLAAVLVLTAILCTTPGPQRETWVEQAGWLLGLCLRALMVFQAGRFFAESRRTGAMELLLSSPLSPREVVGGQMEALRRLFLGPTLVVMGIHLWPAVEGLPGFLHGSSGPGFTVADVYLDVGWGLYGAMVLAADLCAAAWLSLLMSLAGRRPGRATALALLYAVVLPSLVPCVPRILIDLPIIFAAKDRLRREFMLLARRPYERSTVRRGLVPAPLAPR